MTIDELRRALEESEKARVRASLPKIQEALREFVASRGYDPRLTPVVRMKEK